GCNAIMDALARVFVRAGGRIETSSPVASLDITNGRVSGLHLGGDRAGERVPCDHAVINADAAWAIKNLIPERLRGRDSDRSVDRKKYSCSTFMLYLGVEGEVDLPHHTIRTAPAYERNLEDISRGNGARGSLTDDPSFYVCNPSVTDPGLAPRGDSSVYVLLPTPNGKADIDWSTESDRLRELLLDRIEGVLGQDLRGRVRAEKRISPDDWRAMNINHGATFNLAHSLDQMLHKRPQHKLPYCEGAWLVGGGTHPGSGLPVIFLSAQITASMLCERLGVGGPEMTPGDPGEFNAFDAAGRVSRGMEPAGAGA
ncbi:MAG: phytoene desaturase, partial [Planctomycetota bacterium]